MPPSSPGDAVADGISDIASATDGDAVAAAAARALESLFDAPVDCYVYTSGQLVGVGASDGCDPASSPGDVLDGARDGEQATISVDGAGTVVLWTESDATPPEWALRSIAGAAAEAASNRAVRARQAQRIDRLGDETERLSNFASIVAHDLRNPLAVAQGQFELARERGDEHHFEKVADAHDRIQRIIDHTLTMARQDDDQDVVPVGTGDVAQQAWESVETGEATLSVSESLRVAADPDGLQQLFENLFRNAVEHGTQAMQNGGEPANDAGLTVEVGALTDQEGFFVADDGPGIPEPERSSVFELGYSEEGGTGLGLSIIADIADEHGWEATVTDNSEVTAASQRTGARFEFRVDR